MKEKKIRYTDHCLQRMSERKINKALVQECVNLGECEYIDESYHYSYKDLVVVLAKNNVSISTTYWRVNQVGA